MQFYCQYTIRPKKDTKLCLRVENGVCRCSIFFLFLHKASWILLFVSFPHRIRQCFRSSTIRIVSCTFFINKQFHTCANAFPNELIVMSNEYCAGKHWILYWIQENETATYFLRSRLFTYDVMKNFNCSYYKASNIGNS